MRRPVAFVMRHPTQSGLSVLPTRCACRMMAPEKQRLRGNERQEQDLPELCRGGSGHPRRGDDRLWRVRGGRHADQPLWGGGGAGRQGADLRVEFDARRRHSAARGSRYGPDDPERAGQKGGLRLYRADPRLAAADPDGICRERPDRGRTDAARDIGRAHARGRRRHPGFLYPGGGRHRTRRGARDADVQRPRISAGARPAARLRDDPRLSGRCRWQSAVPPFAAQFQPDHGDGGAGHDRRGRGGHPAGRRDRPRRRAHAGDLCASHRQDPAAARGMVAASRAEGVSHDEREGEGTEPPADVRPAGDGIRRRLDRQSRHRHPDLVLEFRFRRQGDHLSFRERGDRLRPAGAGRQRGSAPGQCRRPARDPAAGSGDRPSRRFIRDDPRRADRCDRARRLRGRRKRRFRQLEDGRAAGRRHRRGDGSRGLRQARLCRDGAPDPQRQSAARRALRDPGDGARRRQPRRHQFRTVRGDQGGPGAEGDRPRRHRRRGQSRHRLQPDHAGDVPPVRTVQK